MVEVGTRHCHQTLFQAIRSFYMQLNIKVEFPPINLNQNTSILNRGHCKTAELRSRRHSMYKFLPYQSFNITYHRSEEGVLWTALFITQFHCLETIDNTHWWLSTRLCFLLHCYFQMTTVETLYNTINFCWSTHKRHSIARPKGRGMGCVLWVQRATYCVDLSILSSMKYFL